MRYNKITLINHFLKIFICNHIKAFVIGRFIMVKPYLRYYLISIQHTFTAQLINYVK